jgi:predicted kinase
MGNRMILIRGVSGAGKSTHAQTLIAKGFEVFEADQYFMQGGEYRFDPSKLSQAHQDCQSRVENALKRQCNVAIANTFTETREASPYVEMGCRYGYNIEVVDLGTSGLSAEELAYRNVHAVPLKAIQAQIDRYSSPNLFAHWLFSAQRLLSPYNVDVNCLLTSAPKEDRTLYMLTANDELAEEASDWFFKDILCNQYGVTQEEIESADDPSHIIEDVYIDYDWAQLDVSHLLAKARDTLHKQADFNAFDKAVDVILNALKQRQQPTEQIVYLSLTHDYTIELSWSKGCTDFTQYEHTLSLKDIEAIQAGHALAVYHNVDDRVERIAIVPCSTTREAMLAGADLIENADYGNRLLRVESTIKP